MGLWDNSPWRWQSEQARPAGHNNAAAACDARTNAHDNRLAPATHVQAVQHVKQRAYTSRTNLQLSRDTWFRGCRRASASLLPCHTREGLIESLHKRFQKVLAPGFIVVGRLPAHLQMEHALRAGAVA